MNSLHDAADFFTQLKSLASSGNKFKQTAYFEKPASGKKGSGAIIPTFEKLGISNMGEAFLRFGNRDFIFFGNDHGLVFRLSRDGIYSKLTGFQVLPIGWIDMGEGWSLAIYPGEQLTQNYIGNQTATKMCVVQDNFFRKFESLMVDERFSFWDMGSKNVGFIQSDFNENLIAIDTDNITATYKSELACKRQFLKVYRNRGSVADAMAEYIALNTTHPDYKALGLRHYDLRSAFFEAWPDAHLGKKTVDVEKMRAFFELAKSKTEKPKRVIRYDQIESKNSNGVMVREELRYGPCYEGLTTEWKQKTLKTFRDEEPFCAMEKRNNELEAENARYKSKHSRSYKKVFGGK